MGKLEGRTAVITGCNRGIGNAIFTAFAAEGANIVACTRSVDDNLLARYAECEAAYGVKIFPVRVDLADRVSIAAAIKEICALKTPVDILVNNAGILDNSGLTRLSLDRAEEVMQVNYFAPLQLTRGLLKLLIRSPHPSIINIASVSGINPIPGNTAYGASKAALINSTKCWAKELGKAKIRVNAIAPGYISTEIIGIVDADLIKSSIGASGIARLGQPAEVARVAVFLASDDSSYVNGETITVDGCI